MGDLHDDDGRRRFGGPHARSVDPRDTESDAAEEFDRAAPLPPRSRTRRRRGRGIATDRDALGTLPAASDSAQTARLQGLWDVTREDSLRLAARFEALAPSWRDVAAEDIDEDEAEAELMSIAQSLRCTRTVARRWIHDAHTATVCFPRCFERLCTGELPGMWFQRMLQRSRVLEERDLAIIDATIARWDLAVTAEQFHRRLSQLLTRLIARREQPPHLRPEGQRRVELLPAGIDGVGCLRVLGPAPEILELGRRLDAAARAAQAAQRHALEQGTTVPCDPEGEVDETAVPSSLGRLRYHLLTGAVLDTDGVEVPSERFRIGVTVPVLTLLGVCEEPGMLDGVTPIPAQMARELAGRSTSWHRILTDPASGAFLPLPAQRYKPSAAMLEHLRLRNATCAVPGCTRPSSWASECDHIVEYDHADPESGGLTRIENLNLLCWAHHRAKTAGYLDPVRLDGPVRDPGRTEWEIHERLRISVSDNTDLATPVTVAEFEAIWAQHQHQQRLRAERAARRKNPPPDPPPPY